MQSEKMMFKPLVETPEGKLISIWAGRDGGGSFQALEYREGEITYTPPKTPGIWLSESLEEARRVGMGNKNKLGMLVVHEALALGNRMPEFFNPYGALSAFSNNIRYPATLLGKEVWREEVRPEPEPPKEEWEEVTKDITFAPYPAGEKILINLLYHDETVFWLGINGIIHPNPDKDNIVRTGVGGIWKVEECGSTGDGAKYFRVFKKVKQGGN